MPLRQHIILSVVIAATCGFVFIAHAFNLDTTHAILFTDKTSGKSYFGYSVGLLTNSGGSRVLVGAPRANSSSDFSQQVVEPGVIYSCSIRTEHCDEIQFHRKSRDDEPRLNMRYFIERRSNGWLGVSLDVADTAKPNVVACGHLWKSVIRGNWFTNGLCYTIDSDLSFPSIRRLLPLIDTQKRFIDKNTYWYSFGMAGFSSHFVENTEDLILGAPGVLDWKGTFIYSQQPEYNRPKSLQTFHIPFPNVIPSDSYFGYSVTSGVFFNPDETLLVAGAPRDGTAGSVYIFETPTVHSKADEEFTFRIKFEGTQMGEYFGGSVCAVDINNDQLSDLLVGAPLHSVQQEEGIVYVYINSPNGRLAPASENLMGSLQPLSRFGSAISSIGDLDQDGFNDVAVGAPYEGVGGAVYVYRGSSKGLVESQKILASDIDRNLRGFGVSISRGKDVDKNLYSDLAIGAHDSSHTVVLRSFPVVKLNSALSFNISQVNLNSSSCRFGDETTACFSVMACITYSGTNVVEQLDVTNTMTIGTAQQQEKRAFFASGSDSVDTIEVNITLRKDIPECKSYDGHVLSSTQDVITPIQFNSKVKLRRNPRNETKFCENCPISDSVDDTIAHKSLSFVTNCGDDDICDTDLQLESFIDGLEDGKDFVVGSSSTITLVAEVTNNGPDPAYLSRATISFPPQTSLSRLDSNCQELFEGSSDAVMCDLGNPIDPGRKVILRIIVDVSELQLETRTLYFAVNVTTLSNDNDEDNNAVSVVLPVTSDIDVTIIGDTQTENYVLSKEEGINETLNSPIISHTYKVYKHGASRIESVTVEVGIPNTEGGELVTILTAEPRLDGRLSQFDSCSGILSALGDEHNNTQSPEPPKKLKHVSSVSSKQNTIDLGCDAFPCVIVRCSLGPLVEQEIASVTVAMQINLKSLRSVMGDKQSVRFISRGKVVINDAGIEQMPKGLPDESEVITEFIKEGLPPAKELDDWIIPVCVIAGILLLVLIALLLAKLGFFRRKEKEELEKMSSAESDKNLLGNGEANNGVASSET